MARAILLSSLLGVAAIASGCDSEAAAGPRVVIDGLFEDWDSVAPVLADPLENGPGAVDFGELRIESDDGAVYFAIDLARAVTLQAMYGTVHMVLDADGNADTGVPVHGIYGADRVIALSPARTDGRIGQGMATRLAADTAWSDVYGIGLLFAPTYASRYKELRIPRAADAGALFTADSIRGRLLYFDVNGELADQTDIFRVALRPSDGRSAVRAAANSIERAVGTTFRLLTWNVSDRGPIEETEAFTRILSALAPDVVLFDEVAPDIDGEWFAGVFAALPGDWTVVRGTAGGRQTSLVASRLPLRVADELSKIEYPDSIFQLIGQPSTPQLQADLRSGRADGLPTVGAILDVGGTQVLLLPIDLQCCGHAASAEERARTIVADAVRAAILARLEAGDIGGVIIGGDLNLVGARNPLDILGQGIDPAGGDLSIVPALRLDGASDATWRSVGPFAPGRLDYVLHSRSTLDVLRAFAFASEDLSTTAMATLGIERDDAVSVSDHLPIVVDFSIR